MTGFAYYTSYTYQTKTGAIFGSAYLTHTLDASIPRPRAVELASEISIETIDLLREKLMSSVEALTGVKMDRKAPLIVLGVVPVQYHTVHWDSTEKGWYIKFQRPTCVNVVTDGLARELCIPVPKKAWAQDLDSNATLYFPEHADAENFERKILAAEAKRKK